MTYLFSGYKCTEVNEGEKYWQWTIAFPQIINVTLITDTTNFSQ